MSSSRTLFAALCLPLLAMPVTAQETKSKTFEQWKADTTLLGKENTVTVAALLERTRDRDAHIRAAALRDLAARRIDRADVARVVKALGERVSQDSEAIIRYEAAKVLMKFGAAARAAIPDLLQGIGDSTTWELREACILALFVVASADEEKGPDPRVTDALILHTKAINEPSRGVRYAAIRALVEMGPPHDANKRKQVLLALQEHFHDANKPIRIWAQTGAMILEMKLNEENLKTIADYLQDGDRDVRVDAIEAFESLLERTRRFVPAIIRLLQQEEDSQVIWAACHALSQVSNHNRQVMETLVQLTRFDEMGFFPIARSACGALAGIAADNGEIAASLTQILERKDVDERVKKAVRKILGRVGAIHAEVANALNDMLKEKQLDEGSKYIIRKALHDMGKSGGERNKDREKREIAPERPFRRADTVCGGMAGDPKARKIFRQALGQNTRMSEVPHGPDL